MCPPNPKGQPPSLAEAQSPPSRPEPTRARAVHHESHEGRQGDNEEKGTDILCLSPSNAERCQTHRDAEGKNQYLEQRSKLHHEGHETNCWLRASVRPSLTHGVKRRAVWEGDHEERDTDFLRLSPRNAKHCRAQRVLKCQEQDLPPIPSRPDWSAFTLGDRSSALAYRPRSGVSCNQGIVRKTPNASNETYKRSTPTPAASPGV